MVKSFDVTFSDIFSPTGVLLAGVNDLFLDSQGNISFSGTSNDKEDQLNAVLYACQTASQTQLGECIYNTARGLPNFQVVWNGTPNIPLWESALRNILLSVPGVVSIESVVFQSGTETESNTKDDILFYTVTIITEFGEGTINGGL